MIKARKTLQLLNVASISLATGEQMVCTSNPDAEYFAEGDEVQIDGETPEDGEYITKDGDRITVEDGIITDIAEREPETSEAGAAVTNRLGGTPLDTEFGKFVSKQIKQNQRWRNDAALMNSFKRDILVTRQQNLKKLSGNR